MRQRDLLSHRTSLRFIHLVSDNLLHPGSRSFVFSGSCENSSGAVAAVKDRIYKRSAMLPVSTATGPRRGWWVTRDKDSGGSPARNGAAVGTPASPRDGSRLHSSGTHGSDHKGSIEASFAKFCRMPLLFFLMRVFTAVSHVEKTRKNYELDPGFGPP